MLLPIIILVFIVVVGIMVYSNWPTAGPALPAVPSAPAQTSFAPPCGQCGAPKNQCGCKPKVTVRNSCNQCGMPKPQCGCPNKPNCQFC